MDALARRTPWAPASLRQALYLAGGIPAQLAALLPLLAFSAKRTDRLEWVAHRWPWWVITEVLVFLAIPLLTRLHRQRLRVTAGIEIPPQPSVPDLLSVPGILAAGRSRATWRQLGYHLIAGPVLGAAAAAAIGVWLAGAAFALAYTYAWRLDTQSLLYRGLSTPDNLPRLLGIPVDAYLTAAGIAGLLIAPSLTAAVAALDARVATALLGPSRAEELEHRVEQLARTRAGAVDAADAERRRLERDLHDGTQQRLVALAMNLGMARAETRTVDEAH